MMVDVGVWQRAVNRLMRRYGPYLENEKITLADEAFEKLAKFQVRDWTDPAFATEILPWMLRHWQDAAPNRRHPQALRTKMMRLGWCVATGTLNEIEDADRHFVREAFRDFPSLVAFSAKPSPEPLPGDERPAVVTAFSGWRTTDRGGRRGPWQRTRQEIAFPRLPSSDAEVAFRLRVGDSDNWLEIRKMGPHFYRPVMAPGTWTPVGIAEAARAWKDGAPWPDDPLSSPRIGAGQEAGVALGIAEMMPEAHPKKPLELAAAEESAAETTERSALLTAFDDVLHVRTDRPNLALVLVRTREYDRLNKLTKSSDEPRLAWAAPSLRQWDDQRTIVKQSTVSVSAFAEMPEGLRPFIRPPVEAEAEARAFANAWRAEYGLPPESISCIADAPRDRKIGAAFLFDFLTSAMDLSELRLSDANAHPDFHARGKLKLAVEWRRAWSVGTQVLAPVGVALKGEPRLIETALQRLGYLEERLRAANSDMDDFAGLDRVACLAATRALCQCLPELERHEEHDAILAAFDP